MSGGKSDAQKTMYGSPTGAVASESIGSSSKSPTVANYLTGLYSPTQMGGIFGMSGGKGGGSTTNTTINYSPEEAARRALVMSEAERIYGQQAGSAAAHAPAGASPDTLAAQERMRSFATGSGQQMATAAGNAMQFGLGDVLYPETNPALKSTLDTATRTIGEAYTSPAGPYAQIRQNFGSQEGRGSREAIALGLAGRSYLNTVGDVTGKITSDAYNKGLDTFSKTLAVAPQTYALGQQPALTQDAVGQQVEGYQEQQRQWELNAPWSELQNYANIVFGGSSAGTTTNSQGPGTSNVQRAGMAMAGASMGYMAAQGTAIGGPYGAAIGAGIGLLMSYA